MYKYLISSIFFVLQLHNLFAQGEKVQLIHANSLEYDEKQAGKVRKLIGDVQLKQANTLLFCDSAYQYESENRVTAFSNVRIIHNDSLKFYGNRLNYFGNNKQAILEGNARMEDGKMILTTDRLDFDMATNKGYYTNKGKIVSGENILTSRIGYYYANEDKLFFRNQVVLVSPKYKITTDTLAYQTTTGVATFFGPTDIVGDSDRLYCERGTYNTKTDIAVFSKRAVVHSKQNTLYADSIYFNNITSFGRGWSRLMIIDHENFTTLFGDYGEVSRSTGVYFITKQAVAKQMMDNDSMFIFGDTIFYLKSNNELEQQVKCYRNVKMIKSDMQAICDSMVYRKYDSTITLYQNPIVWSGANQITADTLLLHINNNKLDSFKLLSNGFMISREGAKEYNQLIGRYMEGMFEDTKLKFIRAEGNAQSVYYVKDEDSTYLGVNVIECSEMEFHFDNNKIVRSNFITKPEAKFYPLGMLSADELRLKGFKWRANQRPKSSEYIHKLQLKYKNL
jgi:lipopolysaccharide export system protein LptA